MESLLCAVLELTIVLPGLLLAYLPMGAYLKIHPAKLCAVLVPSLTVLCIAGGFVCWILRIQTALMLLAVILISAFIYIRTLRISIWKSSNVILAVCAVFSCLGSISRAIDAILTTDRGLYFCLGASVVYNLLCWDFTAIAFYPAVRPVRTLIADENMAQTWYVFWILPVIFIGLNMFMVPSHEGTLYHGRIMEGYILISTVLLLILGLFYFLFYLMANSLNKNAALQKEKSFLEMQTAQYDNLCTVIEEIRHTRHDMRHLFTQLSAMAEREEWETLKEYLARAQKRVPNLDMVFSENRAADGVTGHYCTLSKEHDIPFMAKIDLPQCIPFDEMDLCIVLANLLENALEASLRTDIPRRYIKAEVHMHSAHILLIYVENGFDGEIKERDGVFQSSKRNADGIGTQSVRRIAEKNGGGCSFEHGEGVFRAKVMLRKK